MVGVIFEPNVITCPKCNSHFAYNMVNGVALIDAVSRIESRKKMYCRLTLDGLERLEQTKSLNFTSSKKIILDNFNDFNRDVQTVLGFGLEVE